MPAIVSRIISGKMVTVNINTSTTPTTDLEIVSPSNNGYLLKSLVFDPTANGTITVTSGVPGSTASDKIILKATLSANVPLVIPGCFAHTASDSCVKVKTSVNMGDELTLLLEIL